MKKSFTLVIALLSCLFLKAQDNTAPFQNGTNVVSAGIGFGSTYFGYAYGSSSPAISLQYERGVYTIDEIPAVISIGGYLGVQSFKYTYHYNSSGYYYKEQWSYKIIGLRGAFHYNGLNQDKIDVYAGLMLGYYINSYKFETNYYGNTAYNGTNNYANSFGLAGYVGGRYFFTPNFGAFAELGYGISYVTIGVDGKF